MSAELERVFSGARRTILWTRGSLGAQIIEVLELLKHWMTSGVVDDTFEGVDNDDEVVIVAQSIETVVY